MGTLARLVRRLGHQPWFATLGKHVAPRLDRFVNRVTAGRMHGADRVLPTLMLEHTGRRSGKTYRTPLAYVRDGDAFVLAASNWGQAHHPAWSGNLLAEPECTVEARGRRVRCRARLAAPEERERLWGKLVDVWPAYATYAERAGREIRVFVLEPA